MADPFSVASGVVGILSLGIQIGEKLLKYYQDYREQDEAIKHTTNRLGHFLDILRLLQLNIGGGRQFHTDQAATVKAIRAYIEGCGDSIDGLQTELDTFDCLSTNSTSKRAAIVETGRRVLYPFRKSTLLKIEEHITTIHEDLSSALQLLGLQNGQQLQDDVVLIKNLTQLVQAAQLSSEIRTWLNAPDATVNHHAACAKRHINTGLWFIHGPQFASWLSGQSPTLWINGFAGTGKSVLCSTAIQHTYRHQQNQRQAGQSIGIAYFYFAFNDERKRDSSAMLRALLQQLSCQSPNGLAELSSLYSTYKNSAPPDTVLFAYLQRLISKLDQAYLFLDALDEVPYGRAREEVLRHLATIRTWDRMGLRVMVTSRDIVDIRERLQAEPTPEISLQSSVIDQDIDHFVRSCLEKDPALLKWRAHHDEIRTAISARANGVFRWVECQLESIKRCPRSPLRLRQCLKTLPVDLDGTYERMLLEISDESKQDARRILSALCFAERPLTVAELADAVAVDLLDTPPRLQRDARFPDGDSFLEICPGLIAVSTPLPLVNSGYDSDDQPGHNEPVVRIAHFSVQEYLESDRIRGHKASYFALEKSEGHSEMTRICVAYFEELEPLSPFFTRQDVHHLPFAVYAAENWYHHYEHVTDPADVAHSRVFHLLSQCDQKFAKAASIHEPGNPWEFTHADTPHQIAEPLYYVSYLGYLQHVESFLAKGADINARSYGYDSVLQVASARGHIEIVRLLLDQGADVDGQSGGCDDALQTTSEWGHTEIVRLLLDKGADANAQGGPDGNALHVASANGHTEIVRLLLDKGADPNAANGVYGSALQVASAGAYTEIVRLLLDKGADANAQPGRSRNVLHEAARCGYIDIVRLLLDKGADINAQSHRNGSVLQETSASGHIEMVRLLLDRGADINAQGGMYGNALAAAIEYDLTEMVRLLLDKGADMNGWGDSANGNALEAASGRGRIEIVQLLLDRGADVNAQSGGFCANALAAASVVGHIEIVQLLLDKGADANAQGGDYSYALTAASERGHIDIVQLLLDKGADLNAQDDKGRYGNALAAASLYGEIEVVQLLLDKGANPDAQGGYRGHALTAASVDGNIEVVQLLLDKGADVNARGGQDGNALQAASSHGHIDIVRLLLDKGADINAQGGRYGNALQAAIVLRRTETMRLLLDKGADVNVQGGWYGNALQAASEDGQLEEVQLLLDKGADINAQGGRYGNALQAASKNGYIKVVRLLLHEGADVNAQGGEYGNALAAAIAEDDDELEQVLRDAGAVDAPDK